MIISGVLELMLLLFELLSILTLLTSACIHTHRWLAVHSRKKFYFINTCSVFPRSDGVG